MQDVRFKTAHHRVKWDYRKQPFIVSAFGAAPFSPTFGRVR